VALTCAAIGWVGCASIEAGRYGVRSLSVTGQRQVSESAITECLITREVVMTTSIHGGVAMLKKATSKAGLIWAASAELYRDMALSALRLVRR